VVTAANVNDTVMFQAVVDDIPPVRTPAGRRRTRPGAVHADKGYDSQVNRAWLRRRGITARIARRQIDSSTRLGRHRWRVERSVRSARDVGFGVATAARDRAASQASLRFSILPMRLWLYAESRDELGETAGPGGASSRAAAGQPRSWHGDR
jgi:hypothetical protein